MRSSNPVNEASAYREVYYQSTDGLRLFARDYGKANCLRVPVLCLPGLTRNSRDFETVSSGLAQTRRVIAVDFRGRGFSKYAPDGTSYRPDIELADTLVLLQQLNINRVAVIGTSRGGIVAMLMAALQKEIIAGLLLNDIGPVLDPMGLLRIRSYLGVAINYRNIDEAVAGLKQTNPDFEGLSRTDWQNFAKRLFRFAGDKPVADYDPAIAQNFASVDDIATGRVPKLWELFSATTGMPVSVLRGAASDILSVETVAEMKRRNPDLDATTVAGRGHAPFLDEPESRDAITRWLARVDANERGR